MQTRRQSALEVFLDLLFGICFNLVGQRLVYGELATADRMTIFAVVLLTLAFLRRWATRRVFNALLASWRRQPRWHSALETISDAVLGFLVAYVLQVIIYGEAATLMRAGGLTVVIYGLTILRRYVLRRMFVRLEMRTVTRLTG